VKSIAVGALVGAIAASVTGPTAAASLTTEVDGVRIEVSSVPEAPVKDRKTAYAVRLVDSTGTPVTDARVTLTGRMADGMSVAAPLRADGTPGVYRGEVLFTMEGPWELAVRVVRQGRRLEVPLKEEVGR